ncbi:hypothetical protein ACTMU2_27230 [Cupriavidus basilensis]
MSSLVIGVECGGSDTTSGLSCNPVIGRMADLVIAEGGTVIISETSEFIGADHLFAERAADGRVREAFVTAVRNMENLAISRGVDMREDQPSPDNKRGGLTTVEEKALGAMAKAGTTALVGVLRYGEAPQKKGLHFMDAPAAAVENLTALAAGGCQLTFFGTGVGNPIGSVVAPTVKVCGNVNTLRTMADNIDFDVSGSYSTEKRSRPRRAAVCVCDGRRIRHAADQRGARYPGDRDQSIRTEPPSNHDQTEQRLRRDHPLH